MGDTVIFSTPLMCAAIVAIMTLHVAVAVIHRFFNGINASELIVKIICALNLLLHIALLVGFICLKASPEEIVFVLMASSCGAMASSYRRTEE